MKKIILLVIVIVIIGGGAYWNYSSSMPSLTAKVDNTKLDVAEGSYCWSSLTSNECVDKISPAQMIEKGEITPTTAKPDAVLSYKFSKKPLKNSESVSLEDEAENSMEVDVTNQTFKAPTKKGRYIYTISADWDKGRSSYIFVIDVK